MEKFIKTKSGKLIRVPSPEEEAFINAGIAADPDTYVPSDAEFKRMRTVGRPPAVIKRPLMSIRMDPELLEALRATGKGWQTRVHAVLMEAWRKGKFKPKK